MELEAPFTIDALRRGLEARRGRPLLIEPYPLDADVSGLWIALPDRDLVLYQAATTSDHQRTIVLHELGHILAGHQADELDPDTLIDVLATLMPTLTRNVIRSQVIRRRTCYDADDERDAELVSMIISEWAERIDRVTPARSTGDARWLDSVLNDPIGWS